MVRFFTAAVAAAALAIASVANARPDFTVVWIPRATDVGAPGSSDYVLLAGILSLAGTETYTVAPGDVFDFVIRKQFLVSATHPHAYGLYRERILQLNPGLHADSLAVGASIRIPVGPRFGGTELGRRPVQAALRPQVFSQLSAKAAGKRAMTANEVHDFAIRHLAAYVSPFKKATADAIDAAISARGLVAPIDVVKFPESRLSQMQAVDLTVTSESDAAIVREMQQAAPQDVLAGFLPVDASFPVSCSGCTSCASALKLPPALNLSRARVLIEDTGVAPGLVAASNILPQSSGGNGADIAPDSHGTFVYSEIAAPDPANPGAPENGVIPKANVYVARVAQATPTGQIFSMSDMLSGWQTFQAQMAKDSHAAKTWVVNISAASGPDPSGAQPPTILQTDNLLFVAAAGNHNSNTEPLVYAFGRFSSPGTPLLIVGAQDVDGRPAIYSNSSASNVHFFAQGNCICGAPGQLNGTSQAVPIVTIAAATLASQRPTWTALYVMWRLVATADQSPALEGGVFAGTVNVAQALDPLIIVKEGAAASPSVHDAKSLLFGPSWINELHSKQLDDPKLVMLRLYGPTTVGTQRCFAAVQLMQPGHKQVCVDPGAVVSFVEQGQSHSLHAQDITDIILPMPTDRDASLTWPKIAVASAN